MGAGTAAQRSRRPPRRIRGSQGRRGSAPWPARAPRLWSRGSTAAPTRLTAPTASAQRPPDLVQEAEQLPVGPKHGDLVIGDAALLAESPDDEVRLTNTVPGH